MTDRRGDRLVVSLSNDGAPKNRITNTGRDKSLPYILIAITFLIYLNSLPNDFIFDDIPLVQNSLNLMNMSILDIITSYRPLRYLTYVFDYRVFGMNPWGFRLMNILYHSLTVISLFWMLKVFGLSKRAAFISALLFAIHPVNTDAVAYISGRRDVLMGLFYLLSIGWFIKFYNLTQPPTPLLSEGKKGAKTTPLFCEERGDLSLSKVGVSLGNRFLYLFLSLIFMVFSISSKEMGATIPLIFILYIFYKDGSKLLENKYVYLSVMSFLLLFTFFVFITISGGGSGLVSLHGIEFHGNSPEVHYLTAATVWLHYVKLTIFPLKLILDNANYPLVTEWNFLVFFSVLSMFVYGWVVWRLVTQPQITPDPSQTSPRTPLLKKRDLKQGERFESIAFFLVFFVIALAPVLQIIPLHEIVAVHYLYVPVMGFCAAAGIIYDYFVGATFMTPKRTESPIQGAINRAPTIILIIIISFFFIRTITRNFELKDHWTVFHNDEKWAPLSFRGYSTLGAQYVEMKFPDKASEYYMKAFQTGSWDGILLSNIIGLMVLKGDHSGAKAFYEEMEKKNEFIYHTGKLNIAVLYMLDGNCNKAMKLSTSFDPMKTHLKKIETVKRCTEYDFGRYDMNDFKDIYNKQLQMKDMGLDVERKPYLGMLVDLTLNPSQTSPQTLDLTPYPSPEREGLKTPRSLIEGVVKVGKGQGERSELESPFNIHEQLDLIHELAVVNLQSDIPEAIKYYKLEKELYQRNNLPVPEIVERSIVSLEDYSHKVLVEGRYYKLDW